MRAHIHRLTILLCDIAYGEMLPRSKAAGTASMCASPSAQWHLVLFYYLIWVQASLSTCHIVTSSSGGHQGQGSDDTQLLLVTQIQIDYVLYVQDADLFSLCEHGMSC